MIRPIIITGPSGGGKSTLLSRAMKEFPDTFAFSVSHTTRKPRPGEENGLHYYFVGVETMKKMIKNNELFEYTEFGGNIYGTSKRAVEEIQKTGKICVLDVDFVGVKSFKASSIDAKYILVRPSSIKTLEDRLRQRGTETEQSIEKRIKIAKTDLHTVKKTPALFHHVIVNDVLEQAYADFIESISEELAVYKNLHAGASKPNGATKTNVN